MIRFQSALSLALGLIFTLSPLVVNSQLNLLQETCVSDTSLGGWLKCEPSVIMADSLIVVAWNDSYGGMTGARSGVCVAWAYSKNAGKDFKFGGYLPQKENPINGADSWLAKDGLGNIYLQVLDFPYAIDLYRMNISRPGYLETLAQPPTVGKVDRPQLLINDNDNLWLSYTGLEEGNQLIYVLHSVDGGKSWSAPLLVSDTSTASRGGSSLCRIGKALMIAWKENNSSLHYALVEDGQMSHRELVDSLPEKGGVLIPGYSMGFSHEQSQGRTEASLFTNLLHIPGKGVYLSSYHNQGEGSTISFYHYDLETSQWKALAAPGAESGWSFFPTLAMIDGFPALLFYERRNKTEQSPTDVILAVYRDEEWSQTRLNSEESIWQDCPGDSSYAPMQRNFGDYISLNGDGKRLIAAWTDGRWRRPVIFSRLIEVKE